MKLAKKKPRRRHTDVSAESRDVSHSLGVFDIQSLSAGPQ